MPVPAFFASRRTAGRRYWTQYMEDVIFEGGHGRAYDPEETQSQDGRGQFTADEEADDRADYDHGDSWHEDDDIYVEGDGDEEEGNDVDISGEPLFIDELTQRAEAQKKRKSIRTGSYTQDEDKLICQAWMEISQDPRTGAQQKGLVFWTRVHKTFHERKMFEPYQITSNRGIGSIQKRWLFIQQECNKYCAAFESVEARPVSGLGVGDMVCSPLPSPFLATAMRLRPCICLHVHLLLIMWCRHFNLWRHSRPGTMTSHSLLRIVGRSSTIALSSRINTVNFKGREARRRPSSPEVEMARR